jgi:hypothetical protein
MDAARAIARTGRFKCDFILFMALFGLVPITVSSSVNQPSRRAEVIRKLTTAIEASPVPVPQVAVLVHRKAFSSNTS